MAVVRRAPCRPSLHCPYFSSPPTTSTFQSPVPSSSEEDEDPLNTICLWSDPWCRCMNSRTAASSAALVGGPVAKLIGGVVSGAVAERIKFPAFIVFSIALTVVIYSVSGHWIWGGGWLASLGFWDFAGSTQVHALGGWAALTGIIVLGPRQGKYRKDRRVHPIPIPAVR